MLALAPTTLERRQFNLPELPVTWQPPQIQRLTLVPKPAPKLAAKELKVLRRLAAGCSLIPDGKSWRLSSRNRTSGYCKVRNAIVDRLVEKGLAARWNTHIKLTGAGRDLIAKVG